MDPRKLLYLVSVIEEGSLAKAARHLSVSQPALSKSMDRLEGELGMKLLERGPAGIRPTTAGELIYAHARLIKDELDLTAKRIQREAGSSPVITIGTLPSLSSNVVPIAVSRWRVRHPGVVLRVVEKVQVELLVGLHRGEFNFILGQTEFFDVFLDGLKQRVLFRDRLCVFARRGHPLSRRKNLSWADLARFPWVCPMVGWPQRTILEKLVEAEGIEPPAQLVECGSIDFTKSLVAASDHLAMLPAHAVALGGGRSVILPLAFTLPALKRDIALIFRERSPIDAVSKALIEEIEAVGIERSL